MTTLQSLVLPNLLGYDLTITYKVMGKASWGVYKYRIYLSVKGCGKAFFTYYGSFHDAQKGLIEMDQKRMKIAFECFVNDAYYADVLSESDFCAELYAGRNRRQGERDYIECGKSLDKFNKLFPTLIPADVLEHLE